MNEKNKYSLEELARIVTQLEKRESVCEGKELAKVRQLLKHWRSLYVEKQESIVARMETLLRKGKDASQPDILDDPRLSGSAPPLVRGSKFHEFAVNLLSRFGFKTKRPN